MKKTGQGFLEGAMILTLSTAVVKVIGALFKVPLANILGGVGMSYFVSAYDIFAPVYSVTVTGLGVAASRLVSEQAAAGGPAAGEQVLRASRRLFLWLGLLGTALLLGFGQRFAQAINNPGAAPAICAIAPAVLFSCVSAAYRGYFQGMTDMVPTAKSQVLESLVRLLAGIGLSYGVTVLLRRRYLDTGAVLGRSFPSLDQANLYLLRFSAAAAILGVTASTLAGAVYIRGRFYREAGRAAPCRAGRGTGKGMLRKLLRIAVPISLSALVVNLTSVIDLISVMNCLGAAAAKNGEAIRLMYAGSIPAAVTDEMLPEYLYGSYSGLAFSLFNLAPAITAALGVSALPAVARAYAAGDRRRMEETVDSALRAALLVSLPMGLGLAALPGPILRFLYPARLMESAIITPVLRVMGISTILVAAATPMTSVLQAVGREKAALGMMTLGALIKLCTNIALVSRPEMNIRGVPYGSLFCYGFLVLACGVWLRRRVGVRLRLFRAAAKPLFCAALCAGGAYSCHYLLFSGLSSPTRLLASIACGGAIYLISLLLTAGISEKDLEMLPRDGIVRKFYGKDRRKNRKNT